MAETAGLEPARVWLDCLANSYGYRFITFPRKNLERAIGFEPMINGFADRRLCPLGYARNLILDFGLPILDWRLIRNPKSEIGKRTTGLEPAISNLKGWRLQPFAYVLAEMRVKRFELLHKLGLSQSPLPLGYTRSLKINRKILAARFELAHKQFLKLSPLPIGLRERGDFGFRIADWNKSKIELVSKTGFSPARVSFSQHCIKHCASHHSATST